MEDCPASLDRFAMPGLSWYQRQTTAVPKPPCVSSTNSSLLEEDLRFAIQLECYLTYLSDLCEVRGAAFTIAASKQLIFAKQR